VGAPGGLAVDGNEIVAVWPQRGDPALEAASEQERVDAVDEGAQPALAGDAVVEGREAAQTARWCVPQATMSSKSSQEAMVAQVTRSSTSWRG
jgi:IS5 family transposase